jgi:hypothetical protein
MDPDLGSFLAKSRQLKQVLQSLGYDVGDGQAFAAFSLFRNAPLFTSYRLPGAERLITLFKSEEGRNVAALRQAGLPSTTHENLELTRYVVDRVRSILSAREDLATQSISFAGVPKTVHLSVVPIIKHGFAVDVPYCIQAIPSGAPLTCTDEYVTRASESETHSLVDMLFPKLNGDFDVNGPMRQLHHSLDEALKFVTPDPFVNFPWPHTFAQLSQDGSSISVAFDFIPDKLHAALYGKYLKEHDQKTA